MHRGYIKVWRKIRETFIWEDQACLKLWLHLLIEANHKETETIFNNEKMVIRRGQLICGRQQLERELGINESKIYRMMVLLEKEQLIEQQKTNRYTIVSIVKYGQYQDIEQQIEQPVNNQRTTSEQPVNTSKELIRMNKNEKHTTAPECLKYFGKVFEEKTGSAYHADFGKDGAIFKSLLKQFQKEEIFRRIDKFFEKQDDFLDKAGYTVGVFKSRFNSLSERKDGIPERFKQYVTKPV